MYSLLQPVKLDFDIQEFKDYGWLGGDIDIHTVHHQPDVSQADIFILGVPLDQNSIDNEGTNFAPGEIRKALYQLFPGKWQKKIVDLGNIKISDDIKTTYSQLSEIVEKIIISGKSLIIIGGSQETTHILTKIYDLHNKAYNLCVIDAIIDSVLYESTPDNENYLTDILTNEQSLLHNLSLIGVQTYYNHPSKFDIFDKLYVEYYKLGEVQKDLYEVEPDIRDAHIVSIDTGVIRNADMPAQKNSHPNGFSGQEICVLTRMAGISVQNNILGIFEYNPFFDKNHTGSNLIAQMIWYYIEGKNTYQPDYPLIDKKELIKFIIDNEIMKLNFYKNPKTERWWVEIPEMKEKNKLFSCNEKDYYAALELKFTKRIYQIINKISL